MKDELRAGLGTGYSQINLSLIHAIECTPAHGAGQLIGALCLLVAQTYRTPINDKVTMTTPQKPKPFSMIREFHLADWFTLGNAISGIGALFSTMTYLQTGDIRHIYFACAISPWAMSTNA